MKERYEAVNLSLSGRSSGMKSVLQKPAKVMVKSQSIIALKCFPIHREIFM